MIWRKIICILAHLKDMQERIFDLPQAEYFEKYY